MFIHIEPDLVINISDHELSSKGYNKILNQIRTFILNQPNQYNNQSSLLLLITLSFFYSLIFLLILLDLYIQ